MTHMTMSSDAMPGAALGSGQCKKVALSIVDDFTAQLIAAIESAPQGMSVSDIRAFVETYRTEYIHEHDAEFKTHFQSCLTRCEQVVFDPASRREPFKRVLTSRFVDLFPPLNGLDDSRTYVSRRMLQGLFLALEKMVGDVALERGHITCKNLVELLKATEQGFVWEDLFQNEQAQGAVDDLLMALLPHFSNPMKRINWMVNLINNDLSDPKEFAFEGPANQDWQIDERDVVRVLRRVFRHLKQQLVDKQHAMAMAAKYGTQQTRALLALVNTLDAAEV